MTVQKKRSTFGFGYWRGDWWRKRRVKFLQDHFTGTCWKCGADTEHPQVHHKNYRHPWAERDTDLMILCRECHMHIHGLDYAAWRKPFPPLYGRGEAGPVTVRKIASGDLDRLNTLAAHRKDYREADDLRGDDGWAIVMARSHQVGFRAGSSLISE
jgi:hypothetical protein